MLEGGKWAVGFQLMASILFNFFSYIFGGLGRLRDNPWNLKSFQGLKFLMCKSFIGNCANQAHLFPLPYTFFLGAVSQKTKVVSLCKYV